MIDGFFYFSLKKKTNEKKLKARHFFMVNFLTIFIFQSYLILEIFFLLQIHSANYGG